MRKASEDQIDIMFLYERYTQGDCQRTVEKVNDELIKIKRKTSMQNTLKDQITIYVKELGWKEYHTAQSSQDHPHSIEYFREHLIHIIQDSISLNKTVKPSSISLPMQKELPTLGNVTIDIRAKNEEYIQNKTRMNNKCIEVHN